MDNGLKLKQNKDAGAKESAQPPKKGPASKPKKKPNLGTKSVQSGPKKKKKLAKKVAIIIAPERPTPKRTDPAAK